MGADQSSVLKSQRDEVMAHTSYSIGKPISGETPKPSPRLGNKKKSSPVKDHLDRKHDIVVVTAATSGDVVDPELKKLDSVPTFLPVLNSSANLPNLQDPEVLEKLDTKALLLLCARYQEHMKQCAEAVAFDQNALCLRIKEVDFTVQMLYSALQDRQKKYAKYAEQIQKVSEMHTALNKIKMNLEQTIPLMERLNSVLPADDQLEPFSMKTTKS